MKTIVLGITLIALLALALPATAQDEHECPHSGDTIAALKECVAHAAAMGHIDSPGVADGLLRTLDSAQRAYDAGKYPLAVRELRAFIAQVQAQSGQHIDPAHAKHIIQHARAVIDALSQP